jgi:hypothetical protein
VARKYEITDFSHRQMTTQEPFTVAEQVHSSLQLVNGKEMPAPKRLTKYLIGNILETLPSIKKVDEKDGAAT